MAKGGLGAVAVKSLMFAAIGVIGFVMATVIQNVVVKLVPQLAQFGIFLTAGIGLAMIAFGGHALLVAAGIGAITQAASSIVMGFIGQPVSDLGNQVSSAITPAIPTLIPQ